MSRQRKNSTPQSFDEEVAFCIEHQMIPTWDLHGLNRLAVSAPTLQEFRGQSVPKLMAVREKKRQGKRTASRKRSDRSHRIVATWPEDDLESIRFPMVVFVRSGQAELQLGDYVVSCPENHFLLLREGIPQPAGREPHLEEPRANKECEIWWFHFTTNSDFMALSVCYSVENKHVNSGHYYIVENRYLSLFFQFFVEEMVERPDGCDSTVPASFQLFLTSFLREIKAKRFRNRGIDNVPSPARTSPSPIEMACHYIDNNLNHPLTIDVVAKAVFLARTNFIAQFRTATGKNFREYLVQRRLEESQHWLLNDACSIQDVAILIGLKTSQFYKLFKQHFGMTPLEFRRANKSGQDQNELTENGV